MLYSEWDDKADVCTICSRKSETEKECIDYRKKMPNDYQGMIYPKCNYCQAAPAFHHGRCCPNKASNRNQYWIGSNGRVQWPQWAYDEECRRRQLEYAKRKPYGEGHCTPWQQQWHDSCKSNPEEKNGWHVVESLTDTPQQSPAEQEQESPASAKRHKAEEKGSSPDTVDYQTE